jgi:hypothetical protein
VQRLARRQPYGCARFSFPPHILAVPNDFLALDPEHVSVPEDRLHLIVVCMLHHRNASVFCSACAGVLAAQGPIPTMFMVSSRLAADLAGAKGFFPCGRYAFLDGVSSGIHVEAQPAEFLFDLQHLERLPACMLGFRNERLQVLAQPPYDVEPAVSMDKAVRHSGFSWVASDAEPRWPTLNQLLFQFLPHIG